MSKSCQVGSEKEFGVNHSNAIDFIKVVCCIESIRRWKNPR